MTTPSDKKTLRDEYAMAAMIAMGLPPADMVPGNMVRTARRALAWADIMMEERDTDPAIIKSMAEGRKF